MPPSPPPHQLSASTTFLWKALSVTTVGTTSVGCWLWYDYKTCHPMRKLKYQPRESLVRFHNVCVNQMPFISRVLSLKDLQQHYNGKNGKPTFISAGGKVYDVSTSDMFRSTYKNFAGQDATIALAKMSLDVKDVSRMDTWKQLSPQDQKSLQSWTNYFDEKYYIKGRLKEYITE